MMFENSNLTLEQVEGVLQSIRPSLEANGGGVELNSIDGDDARIVLRGGFERWPTSRLTLILGIERVLRESIPGFGKLIAEEMGKGEMP